jgi:hypothetical protein
MCTQPLRPVESEQFDGEGTTDHVGAALVEQLTAGVDGTAGRQ